MWNVNMTYFAVVSHR